MRNNNCKYVIYRKNFHFMEVLSVEPEKYFEIFRLKNLSIT
ncbi:hypothetical protein GCWU000282_03107 [Catonella morbi ATCC 51271]|uniref:Uncharacterized protein n=1 Tax=Catonella morbi ATCC 51271 TaxID=592026 RepID=V2XXU5_9FIRM|nr:hypothetical protein GCWU000282_03107 [Catonella morbi ATCC 51271]